MKELINYIKENGVKFLTYREVNTRFADKNDKQSINILCDKIDKPGVKRLIAWNRKDNCISLRVTPYNEIPYIFILPSECIDMIETYEEKVNVRVSIKYKNNYDSIQSWINLSSKEAIKYYMNMIHIHGYEDAKGTWQEEKGISTNVIVTD